MTSLPSTPELDELTIASSDAGGRLSRAVSQRDGHPSASKTGTGSR
jgi:hypothetical protein